MSAPVVFISSTAEDLKLYRDAARLAAERAALLVIGMESFEGRDERPLAVCQEKVALADVVVAIVAHRYGWVPPDQPPAPDGSRDRSITWLECEHARSMGKEVLAFVVDEKLPWPPEHSDAHALATAFAKRAASEQIATVQRNVQRLGDFKRWLDERTRPRFGSPDDFGGQVLHALTEWKKHHRQPASGEAGHASVAAATTDPRKYLEALGARTAYIDIRGLQVGSGKAHRFPIDELYITLTTAASAPEKQPRDAGRGRKKARGRAATGDEAKGIVLERPRPIVLDEALRHERLVLVGDPGSGKTTFLHRVAHALCQTLRGDEPEAASRRLGLEDQPFPILVRLADLAEHVKRHRRDGRGGSPVAAEAPAWLPHFLAAQSEDEVWGLGEEFFRKVLEEGPCLVLLDGLDEAPDRVARESLSRLVENVARAYAKARVVVTSRPGAYVGATVIPEFAQVQIEPLGPEAVQVFLTRWSEAIWPGAPREAARHREELVGALRVPEIARLARNPVMLTALAVVHWNERRLPEQRADLYESIIKWLSRAREQRPERPSAERCVTVLQELALAMQAHPGGRRVQVTLREGAEAIAPELAEAELRDLPERRRLEAAERFLVDEELDSGIVIGRGQELRFWHLTFQEFLAARAIAGRSEADQRASLLAGEGRLYASEWREVVLLLCGVLHQHGRPKLDGLVAAMLTALGREPSLAALARCVGLLGTVQRDLVPFSYEVRDPRYRGYLDQVRAIFDAERSRSIPIEVRIEAADALGQAEDRRLEAANPERWVSIPAGTFRMGAQKSDRSSPNFDEAADDDESPVHEVELDACRIGRYPVTVGEYRVFVDDGGYGEQSWWQAGGHDRWPEPDGWSEQLQYPSRPVVGVSWYEAKAFCAWAAANLRWTGREDGRAPAFTSIHIEEFEIQARDSKLGKEEITRNIPNVSEEVLKDLDYSGIVRIGAKLKPGDIMVGKITPKGETQLTPEEKLLSAIFREKAGDVRDTSLTVPPGIEGTVVDVKVFSRRGVAKDERAKSIEEEEIGRLEKDYQDQNVMVEMERDQKLKNLLVGKTLAGDLFSTQARASWAGLQCSSAASDPTSKQTRLAKKGDRIERAALDNFGWKDLKRVRIKEDEGLAQTVRRAEELAEEQIGLFDTMLEEHIVRLRRGDDPPPGVIKMVKVYVAVKRKLSVGDKMAGRHGNKGVVAKVLPEEDMPFLACRLPTEAEWERAARGTAGRKYAWGATPIDAARANYEDHVGYPTPVGVYPLGATPEGIHDLAGNVWEWCDDAKRIYRKSKEANPRGRGDDRVLRGGSWHLRAGYCRAAYRLMSHPGYRDFSIGFRMVIGIGGGPVDG